MALFAIGCALFLLALIVVTRDDRARLEQHRERMERIRRGLPALLNETHYWGPWQDMDVGQERRCLDPGCNLRQVHSRTD